LKRFTVRTGAEGSGSAAGRAYNMLFMGRAVEPVVVERATGQWFGIVAGLFFAIALGGICIGLWIFGRGDRKFRETVLAKHYAIDQPGSLDRLDLNAPVEPDFDYLKRQVDDPS
jgi:hypothetical protein